MPVRLDGEALGAGRADRAGRGGGGGLRHRPRHPSRRDDPRHQGAGRVRGAGRRGAAHRPPGAREAGRSPAARSGSRRRSRRSTAIWSTRGSTSIRSAATSRRSCSPRSSGSPARSTSCFRPGQVFVEGVASPYSLRGGLARRLRRGGGGVDGRGRARLLADRGACRASCYARMAGRRRRRRFMKTVAARQDRLGHPRLRPQAGGAGQRRDPLRGGGGGGGAGAQRQEHLQPARAAERPHGAGEARGRDRRRARPPARAVRLLGAPAGAAGARRHGPPAEHRRRARDLRLGEPGPRAAVRVRGARARCSTSPTWASGSASRRGSAASRSTWRRRSTRPACRWSRSSARA